jgi:hypothetical protein
MTITTVLVHCFCSACLLQQQPLIITSVVQRMHSERSLSRAAACGNYDDAGDSCCTI